MKDRTSFEINAINKYKRLGLDLTDDEAIARFKKEVGKGGKKSKGRPAPWAHFNNPDNARAAQVESVRAKRKTK